MKLELKHIACYVPYNIQVQYKGILNGKELGKWDKEFNKLDIFEQPAVEKPDVVIGLKIGLIKKVETYKNHQFLRVGNGHKVVGFGEFGENAFLVLRPLSELTRLELESEGFDSHIDYLTYENKGSEWTLKAPFNMVQYLLSKRFDVYGLIEKGLAIDINTIK